jgi:MFS family permease
VTASGGPDETTEWRAWGESWLAALIPSVAVFAGLVLVYQAATYGWRWLSVVLGLLGMVLLLAGALLLVVLVRTRTRLTAEGIEIRQIGAEVIPWTSIASVQLDRRRANRTITVSLHDGRVRTLPTPTQAKRPPSDPTLPDAVAAMQRRLYG